jgi:hypothetical protein
LSHGKEEKEEAVLMAGDNDLGEAMGHAYVRDAAERAEEAVRNLEARVRLLESKVDKLTDTLL